MEELFLQLVELPALQGALVALTAILSEDPTALASGILVAGGQMQFLTAWLGLALGIIAGDTIIYALGRLVGPKVEKWNLVDAERMDRASRWFDRYGILVIVAARCVPGSRLPTYAAAGALEYRVAVFLGTVIPTAFAWSFLLVFGISRLGEAVLPVVNNIQWLFLVSVAFLVGNLLLMRRSRKRARARQAATSEAAA